MDTDNKVMKAWEKRRVQDRGGGGDKGRVEGINGGGRGGHL